MHAPPASEVAVLNVVLSIFKYRRGFLDVDLLSWSMMMCQNVYARYRCSNGHGAKGEDPLRLKHLVRCHAAVTRRTGVTCRQREDVHILQEDDPRIDCPSCKGETPPESPPESPPRTAPGTAPGTAPETAPKPPSENTTRVTMKDDGSKHGL
ncbi:MAG: hypothetical protein M1834_003267 [Cirrosporium novae-zelandiae]|nr:MAG: hypothetical protein M1834_003267 [Cirrosporium novae-zelandiae]